MTKISERILALVSTVLIPPNATRATILGNAERRRWGHANLATVFLCVISFLAVVGAALVLVLAFELVGLLVLMLLGTIVVLLAVLVRQQNRKLRAEAEATFDTAVASVREYEPKFLLHWDGSKESIYQVEAWITYLEKIDLPFVILVRNPDSFDSVVQIVSRAHVVLAPTPLQMERLLVPSVTTVFYVNNADSNNQILRFERIKHVQLGHGDSDKSSSATRTFRLFDRVYIAGQAGVDRFAAHGVQLDPSVFVRVGRPQVNGIDQTTALIKDIKSPVVLYAPTWSGDFADTSHSSLPHAEGLVDLLLEAGATLIFRPHPFTSRHSETAAAAERVRERIRAHADRTGTPHILGEAAEHELTLTECFNRSDAMISDVSAVSSDYLFSGKPLGIFVTGDGQALAGQNDGLYVFTTRQKDWQMQIEKLLYSDPLRAQRIEMRNHRLANSNTNPPDRLFIEAARNDVLY